MMCTHWPVLRHFSVRRSSVGMSWIVVACTAVWATNLALVLIIMVAKRGWLESPGVLIIIVANTSRLKSPPIVFPPADSRLINPELFPSSSGPPCTSLHVWAWF
ncbi:hypothetical protein GQ53DRAFT_24889 [Thozetella sp. PMI_491]|nr:hypothetical protein GQ53DRAFT_24889 [Thozetella sp. PMI_491]